VRVTGGAWASRRIAGPPKGAPVRPTPDALREQAFAVLGPRLAGAAFGAVAGFIVGGLEDTGENIYGHLCNIGVSPRYRRRGVGQLLVRRTEHQFALELATGVQLEVRVSNSGAQRFYQRMGYRPVFGIDQYYANGEDALVMMKWFRF